MVTSLCVSLLSESKSHRVHRSAVESQLDTDRFQQEVVRDSFGFLLRVIFLLLSPVSPRSFVIPVHQSEQRTAAYSGQILQFCSFATRFGRTDHIFNELLPPMHVTLC